ncbi:uncharacterized protein LOC131932097 isoform X2 [Physella acuta]|uniref:uncharacterized protein LOC131932097 isoform X2 n=1 Tax=Physella acuta TaxID=109671 RepID=UPI0027DDEFAF|nr:uncharacterized protein LOC131932097 isoform X2 [Physella acuta]
MSSSSELPPTSGSSGRSVFTVFGFNGNRYSDIDDFDNPLENAPDSINAAENPLALTKREKALRKKSDTSNPILSPETARKMRLNLSDNSRLVLQSLAQQAKPAPEQHQQSHDKHHAYARRYSNPQGDPVEDTFDTEVLHKFNNTVCTSSKLLLTNHNAGRNFYSNFVTYSKDDSLAAASNNQSETSDTGFSQRGLSRRQSTPNLIGLGSVQTLSQSKSFCLSNSESSVDPDHHTGILTSYLGRQQAQTMSITQHTDSEMKVADTSAGNPSAPLYTTSDMADNIHKKTGSGFSLLTHTRRFGAWLSKATDGEKLDVTKKDLNILAPNSF